jgi:hypothetical protein
MFRLRGGSGGRSLPTRMANTAFSLDGQFMTKAARSAFTWPDTRPRPAPSERQRPALSSAAHHRRKPGRGLRA